MSDSPRPAVVPVSSPLRRVLLTALIPLTVGAICFVAVSLWVVGSVKKHPAYAAALAAVRAEPDVVAALGSPLEPGFFAQGGEDTLAGSFEAMFSVSGPNGEAGVRFLARADGPGWDLVFLDVGANLPGGRQKVFVLRNDELPVRFGVQRDALAPPVEAPGEGPPE